MVVALHRGRGRRVASLSGLSHRARSCHVVLGVVASHRADKPNHQLAAATRPLVTHRLRGRRHRWAISTNPSVSHKSAPDPSSASKPLPSAIVRYSNVKVKAELHKVWPFIVIRKEYPSGHSSHASKKATIVMGNNPTIH